MDGALELALDDMQDQDRRQGMGGKKPISKFREVFLHFLPWLGEIRRRVLLVSEVAEGLKTPGV